MNKHGRPKIPDMGDKRILSYSFRISKNELEILHKAMRFTGANISTMVRKEGLAWARKVIEEAERGKSAFPF